MNKRNKIFKLSRLILRQIVKYFPIIWFLSISVGFLETYFYSGFLFRHLFIQSVILYFLLVLSGVLILLKPRQKDDNVSGLLKKANNTVVGVSGLGYLFTSIVENITYPNYIFSTFHIQPKQLLVPFCLSVFTGFVVYKHILISKIFGPGSDLFRLRVFVGLFLLWIMIPNVVGVTATASKKLLFMIKHPTATYDQKMEEEIGKQFYNYVLFVKENTQETSKILIPPFPAFPWPQTGNGVYMRYFLYPRILLNGEEYSPNHDLTEEGIDYVLIAWGETLNTTGGHTHGWPKFDVKSDEIIYWLNGKGVRKEKGNYIYKNLEDEELWGVIKVKK